MSPARKTLRDGDFVYAKMKGNAIKALFPVQISRELYDKSPWDCVYPSILPAGNIDGLSPADRVFGWVNQDGSGAWKGKIRISDSSKVQTEHFESIPLAILGNPKPAQVRFYLGDQNGGPQQNGISKSQAAYGPDKKLRGRNVALNQSRPDDYWTPVCDPDNPPEYYARPDDNDNLRGGQNRSISSWIPIGSEFRFNIKVENLTREELGAMLALLTLTTQKRERNLNMGYAKPLGFGSFTLRLDLADGEPLPIYTGKQKRECYVSFEGGFSQGNGLAKQPIKEIIYAFKKNMVDNYGEPPQSQMPEIPDSWRNSQRAAEIICTKDEINEFTDKVWKASFEMDADRLSLDSFSLAELLEEKENSDKSIAEELQEIYSQAIVVYRKQMNDYRQTQSDKYTNAWRNISFVDDFLKSTKKYENVHYPRNNPAEKGYEWFTGNEKQKNNAPEYGYSLPSIGGLLDETS
jgi:hypothetical protein